MNTHRESFWAVLTGGVTTIGTFFSGVNVATVVGMIVSIGWFSIAMVRLAWEWEDRRAKRKATGPKG